MEEDLNDNELEERLYSMLHHVDETQVNVTEKQDAYKVFENAPRTTVRRYWRTSGEHTTPALLNTPFQKVNISVKPPQPPTQPKPKDDLQPQPKEEKSNSPEPLPKHLSLFQSPVPKDIKKTIVFMDEDDSKVVELESSDDDEVIEVALPPKPTITIDSSDDETAISVTPVKAKPAQKAPAKVNREISASPVPSVVSSVSDDFIRGDCIALNISSRRPDNHSFDFSLHGSDILGTPLKKKKKKKNKDSVTSTPITEKTTPDKSVGEEECFATPKSKAKNKKQKNKSYVTTDKIGPSIDVYDSDSNHSIAVTNNKENTFIVTEKSLPCADVYESDSNASEAPIPDKKKASNSNHANNSLSNINVSIEKKQHAAPTNAKKDTSQVTNMTIDLTDDKPTENIEENIVMANVTGFRESDDYGEKPMPVPIGPPKPQFGSTKVPAILYEDLDFDNLKGKEKVCKNGKYSLANLRAEMEKFYNESWGGEDFNHKEIQKHMSRDKSLWAIDPKDRMSTYNRKRFTVTCHFCNRPGHRDDVCHLKPMVCFMCGNSGHVEPRCPRKICVNCGSPNQMYSTMCRNCCNWYRIRCRECGQYGHPPSHCPDMWRRYHSTTEVTPYLVKSTVTKPPNQKFCSGCTRQGHLIHSCRSTIPFSGLPINSPYVQVYKPVYHSLLRCSTENQNNQINSQQSKNFQDSTISSATTQLRDDSHKRHSKSPTVHETHSNKKRNMSMSDMKEEDAKSPAREQPQRKRSQSQSKESGRKTDEGENNAKKNKTKDSQTETETTKMPDFIPISSNNRNNKGQIIQDNEVSDSSDVITSARIYVTSDIIDQLKTKEGADWLKSITEKLHIDIDTTTNNSFLSIKGKVGEQETFHCALRDWTKEKSITEQVEPHNEADNPPQEDTNVLIPKKRHVAVRVLARALDSLKTDLGEPNEIYKQLNYSQNRHQSILKQKDISPKQLKNSRSNINTALKKLNMILLGQQGLAGGSTHIKELYSLQDRLVNLRSKNVSQDLRQAIEEHFGIIFSAIPRDDYGILLQVYNNKKHVAHKKKKKPQRVQKIKPFAGIAECMNNENKSLLAEKTKNKLVLYHRRLTRLCPRDNVLKKTRIELMRKLHRCINSLGSNTNGSISSKNRKKMKRIQEQSQQLLNLSNSGTY